MKNLKQSDIDGLYAVENMARALIAQAAGQAEGAAAGIILFDQDPVMNNHGIILLNSAVRAATLTGVDRLNRSARGIVLIVDVTAVPGIDTVTPKIQGKDPASGKYYDILVGAVIVAGSTVVLRIYPGLVAAANLTVSDILPRDWRFVMTHSAGSNFTYTVGGQLVK